MNVFWKLDPEKRVVFVFVFVFNFMTLIKSLFHYSIVVGFFIHQHASAMSVHVSPLPILNPPLIPPPSPHHPSGFSQRTSFECSASCMGLALVISFTYGNIHDSMLSSQIVLPSPSLTWSKCLFLTSVSLLLSCTESSLPSFYIPYMCINILYWCFSF